MSTKDLFKKGNKVLTKSQVGKIKKDLESEELVRDVVKANNRFLSHVDYSEPKNFSFYGSAEKYYEDSFARIYKTYPYDGSQKEKQQWINDSSELDLWIYDKAYPKTTGYLKLDSEQSVFVKGGPNKDPDTTTGQKEELSKQYPTKQGKSNIWDPSLYRNSNLYLDASLGCTVEFWMKLENPDLQTYPFVIGNSNGERIKLRWIGAPNLLSLWFEDDVFTGTSFSSSIPDLFESTWNHYSFTFINSGAKTEIEIYKNGTLVKTHTTGTALGEISQEELYLNINGTMTGVNGTRSNTVSGMYIDDFRFWKTRRTGEEIGRYWNTSVFGGTNTDDDKYNSSNRKVDLGIYYKFNEGITGESSVDEVVLDYSGRISNGSIINYTSSVRSTGSAFDEYLDSNSEPLKNKEEREPIIYPMHPELLTELEKYRSKGLVYDLSNNSSIYHTMPSWITDEDGLRGENVKELSQVISSYFDNAQIQIQELTNLREKKYYSLDTETEKPFFLIRNTLKSQGLDVPDLFTEASVFEEILSRNETSKFEEKIQDVKNTIYQNIYNNLSFIYKSKGTEKSFRNLIRCFGIDDELVKVNLYSDGADYTLEDTRRNTAIKKRYVDFNNVDRENAIVYTKAEPSNADSLSYIGGAGYAWDSHFPNLSFTFETEVIFPKKIPPSHPKYSPPVNSEENIAFLGKYRSGYSGQKIFSLKAIKEGNYASSENVKFSLSFDGQTVETGIFKSVYDNSKWNIAVRMVPKKEISTVASGADTTDYEVQLYCIKTTADIVEEEELISATVTESVARDILATDKYLSIGSRRLGDNPEAASTNEESRLKISSTLFWYDNVKNEEIKAHATDGSNFGRLYPNQDAYSTDSSFNTNTPSAIQVAKRDTLALHWDFSKVSTSDANGEFVVDDLSEGAEKILEDINENSIHLDGVDDCVEVGDYDVFSFVDNDPALDKPFTVSAWVFRSGAQGVFVAKNSGNGHASDWFFGHSSGKIQVRIYDGSGFNIQAVGQDSPAAALPANEWHLVTFTYDGSQTDAGVKIYIDGALQVLTPVGAATYNGRINTNSPLRIGANNANQAISNEFESNIADCYIFGSELSLAQVQELYNNGYVKNLKKHSAYLDAIAWWKMGDDQDSTNALGIKDYVGSHHGTLINNASIVPENTLGSDKYVKSGKYGWFTDLVGHQVTGLGKHFPINDNQVTNLEFIQSAKHRTPEVINSEELVRINSTDDIYYPKDATVTNHFFAVEKSMYQIISDDMMNLFATLAEFNDLIGQPVNRYRIEYKSLEKFRQRYYEKVKNVPSFEKYVELYKWIDSSIGMMIQQLIPMSSNFSADLKNMVESHVLERNKYWTKFPTMEMSGEPPLGIIKGVNELTYNWKDGHAPQESFASFNGTTSYIEVPDDPSLSFTSGPMSISMSIKFPADSPITGGVTDTLLYKVGEYYINVSRQPENQSSAFYFGMYADVTAPNTTPSNILIGWGTSLQADRWYHLTFTYDGGLDEDAYELYIDGTKIQNNSNNSMLEGMPDTSGVLKIGSGNGTLYTQVDMKNLAIYEKVLSQNEAECLYDNANPLFIPELVSLWKLSGDATDSKSTNNGSATDVTFTKNEEEKFLWSDQRGTIEKTFDQEVNKNREILRKVITRTTQGRTHLVDRDANNIFEEENKPLLRKTNGGFHEGRVYVNRALSKPYRFDVQKALTLRGGVNYSETTKDPNSFIRASTRIVPGAETAGVQLNGLVPNPVTYEEWKELYTVKRTSTVTVKDTEIDLSLGMDGDVIYPYYGDSYVDSLATLTNIHNDSYGDDAEIPIQSPFTETWVGGNQHRHVDFAKQTDRPELYINDNGTLKHPQEVNSNNTSARYTRDEVAKRPVNIRNIRHVVTEADYQSDFSASTPGQLPDGWSTIGSVSVQWDDGNQTNKALAFIGGSNPSIPTDELSSFPDDPAHLTNYRVAILDRIFTGHIKVSFKVYEGINGNDANGDPLGLYGCTNAPEQDHKNFLYLQYSTDYGQSWQTSGTPIQPSQAVWDLSQVVSREIYAPNGVILRWVVTIEGTSNWDHWAIDDVVVEPCSVTTMLGNYSKDYEIVQTSGRSKNNRYFVRSEGEVSDTYTASPFVSGALDFTLPDRGRTEHVIVERFSAPGDPLSMSRGHLDRIAEEFSVYSSMNYRNLSERLEHQENLYSHSALYQGSQGYIESSNGRPSVHKINRNTNHIAIGKQHDNAYISYQIPRSDLQYNLDLLNPERKTYTQNWSDVLSAPKEPEYFASFNGTTSYIEVPDDPSLSFSGAMSVSMWFRFSDLSQGVMTPLYKIGEYYVNIDPQPTGNLSAFYLGVKDGDGAGDLVVNFGKDIEVDRWYNLVLTYDGGLNQDAIECYIDGHPVPTLTTDNIDQPMNDTANALRIGSGNGLYWSNIDLSEVALYSRLLTRDDAVGLYNKNSLELDPELVSLWKLDGNSEDSKGNNDSTTETDVTFGTITPSQTDGTDSNDFTIFDASVQSSNNSSNTALFLSGSTYPSFSIVDPPPAGTNFRYIEYSKPIHSKVSVGFRVNEGDVGEYTNLVPLSASEDLYFQYKLGTDSWTTEKVFLQGSSHTFENSMHTFEIDLGQNVDKPLYLRWIGIANSYSTGNWGIDDLYITPFSFIKNLSESDIDKGDRESSVSYADYKGAGWRFIRNAENPEVAKQRRENTFSQLDRTDNSIGIKQTSSYIEPAVSWNKPNTHFILDETHTQKVRNAEAGSLIGVDLDKGSKPISYSYSNDLEFFANPDLTNAIDVKQEREGQFYDSLTNLLSSADLLFTRSIAREIIYPRHRNVGLKKTRLRGKYDTYKFFWKDKFHERVKNENITKIGSKLTKEWIERFDQKYSVDVLDNFYYKTTERSAMFSTNVDIVVADTDILSPSTSGFSISMWFRDFWALNAQNFPYETHLASKQGEYEVSLVYTNNGNNGFVRVKIYDTPGTDNMEVDFIRDPFATWECLVVTYDGTGLDQGAIKAYVDGRELHSNSTDSITTLPANTSNPLHIGNLNGGSSYLDGYIRDFAIYDKELSQSQASEIFVDKSLDQTTSATPVLRLPLATNTLDMAPGANHGTGTNLQFYEDEKYTKVIGDLSFIGNPRMQHHILRKDKPVYELLTGYGSSPTMIGLADAEPQPSYTPRFVDEWLVRPIPSPQLYHNPENSTYRESEGWINRKSLVTSHRVNYNDYESFSEEIKLAAQNYGLVSEFRISEHMDKYVLDNGGNFLAKNYDFLTLDGASHDGITHTLTSADSTSETSSFYSVKKEDETEQVTSYPTSDSEETLILNNSGEFTEQNRIYAPSNSTFLISNSINSTFEISGSSRANFISNEPVQSGINASAIFNIGNTNDFLISNVDDVGSNLQGIGLSQSDSEVMPFTVSIWAQPEFSGLDSNGLWCAGNDVAPGVNNLNLFSRYTYSDAGSVNYKTLGLTFVIAEGGNAAIPGGKPGGTVTDDSTVYTFFHKDGFPAHLVRGRMNHVVFQMIPPEKTSAQSDHLNFAIKLWLDGEELYGVHIREFCSATFTARSNANQAIQGYSPCPIGQWSMGGAHKPWFTDYDTGFTESLVGTASPIKYFVIGNCDYEDSYFDNSAYGGTTPQFPFVGLLDEFCVIRGILPSESIENLYNSGKPNNVNELIINKEIRGNLITEGITSDGEDNEEWDFSYAPSGVSPIFEDNFDSYSEALVDSLVVANYPDLKYTTHSGMNGLDTPVFETTALIKQRAFTDQNPGEAGEDDNKIIVLRSYLNDPSPATPPVPDNNATLYWRWFALTGVAAAGGLGGAGNPKPRLITFKVRKGTGTNAQPTNDDYQMEEPNANEDLWFQYSLDDGASWTTLRQFDHSEARLNLNTTQEIPLPSAVYNSPTPVTFRWISGATAQTPADEDYDHWGIDEIKVYDTLGSRFITVEEDDNLPIFGHCDFDDINWTTETQTVLRATLPVWHRIGVPKYDKVTVSEAWSDDFFDSYVHADNINFIEKSSSKHDTLGLNTSEKVKLKVNAIKKLLPYEGFYPQDRTVQIADLFVQKIKEDILYDEKAHKEQAIQAALQHFFAPGILYNSIKSGVACDWATYTNESGLEPAYFGAPIVHFDANGVRNKKYSPRLFPQWYSSETYDETSTLDLTQPTTVSTEKINPNDLTSISQYQEAEAGLSADNIVRNSYNFPDFNFDYKVSNLVITKEPNKRLPFESLLDPYKYLVDGRNNTEITTQSGDKIRTKNNQHFLMCPSQYIKFIEYNTTANGGDITTTVEDNENKSGYLRYNYPYFEIASGIKNKDSRYEMAINNFVAEATKFFIKDEKLSSFASTKPQAEGYLMESGSVYFMDVVMEKSTGFKIANSPGSLGGRYFGPQTMWLDASANIFGRDEEKVSDAAFAPYVPPYFYESSIVRISFTPSETKKHSLDEIFSSASVEDVTVSTKEYFREQALDRNTTNIVGGTSSPNDGNFHLSPAYKSRMPLSASLELFGKTRLKRQEFDAEGRPVSISTPNNEELDTWVIYSKFECPLFDFSSPINSSSLHDLKRLGISKPFISDTVETSNFSYEFSYLDPDRHFGNPDIYNEDNKTGSGIWAGFGEQKDGAGVTISIRESFPEGVSANTGSLIDVCGFTPETKQVGRVADQKVISEAVVMIPFFDEPLTIEQKLFGGDTRSVYATMNVDDRNFIKIPKRKYVRQKRNLDRNRPAYTLPDGREVDSSSITRMIEGMRKYNIPPLYDFETFDQDPFIMYFFEFNHTLDKEDLSNIWQGVQPKIAKQASLDSVEISHDINEHELFGNFGEIPKGVRWMVFKVKKKAEKSYYNLTEESRDDSRFKFNFDVGTKEPEYGYNYPYDYFTMLEMIQVEANSEKRVSPLEQLNRSLEDDE